MRTQCRLSLFKKNITTLRNGVIIVCVVLSGVSCLEAQDIHFSQISQTPLLINPSQTGVYNERDMVIATRVITNYKSQWHSVTNYPFRTFVLSYDRGVLRNKIKGGYVGVGGVVFTDKGGEVGLSSTHFKISLSGIVSIGNGNIVSGGLQGGIVERTFDPSNAQWGSQFNGKIYDGTIASGETVYKTSNFYGDFAAGLLWTYKTVESSISANDANGITIGGALFHSGRPNQAFFSEIEQKQFVTFTFHGSSFQGIKGTNFQIHSSFLIMASGPSSEIVAGLKLKYHLQDPSKDTDKIKGSALFLGCNYRAGDAIIPEFAIEISNFLLGISYDINVSELKTASYGKGGLEFSIRFIKQASLSEQSQPQL